MYTAPLSDLNNDEFAPAILNPASQRKDNYSIYSFACIDTTNRQLPNNYYFKNTRQAPRVINGSISGGAFVGHKCVYQKPLGRNEEFRMEFLKFAKLLAFQSFDCEPIPVDFKSLVEQYSDVGDLAVAITNKRSNYYCYSYSMPKYGLSVRVTVARADGSFYYFHHKFNKYRLTYQLPLTTNGISIGRVRADKYDSNFNIYYTNHEVYQHWFTPVFGYESVWNSPDSEILSISDLVDGTILNFTSLDSQYNNIPEYPLDKGSLAVQNGTSSSGSNSSQEATYGFRFYGKKTFLINGETHEIEYRARSQPLFGDWLSPIIDKPCYLDLTNGYFLDNRRIPQKIILTSNTDRIIKIGYYRKNPREQYREKTLKLTTVDWAYEYIYLEKDKPKKVSVKGIVLGTLYCDAPANITLDIGDPLKFYTLDSLLYNSVNTAQLFVEWNAIYDSILLNQEINYKWFFPKFPNGQTPQPSTGKNLKILAATNNYWSTVAASDVQGNMGYDANHPLFNETWTNPIPGLLEQPAYQWDCDLIQSKYSYDPQPEIKVYQDYFEPQSDGSFGRLIMDSPATRETFKKVKELALTFESEKYSKDENNPDEPRVATLAWHINRQSEVLGIRVKPDGTIDEAVEKASRIRTHAEGSEPNDPQKYNPNCFGSEGILVRHLPNKFDSNGTTSGGYRRVHDLPQLLAEFHEQANAAMGYQEGTAIEIIIDGQTYRYPNQLALMTELLITSKQNITYSKGAFFSSLVSEQSIKEVIGGMGMRTVDKFLEFIISGKTVKLYYKGISASQSLRRKLSALSTNIAIAVGNIT